MIIKAKTKQLIQDALKEDIGSGDITTSSVVGKSRQGEFIIISNEPCVVCGMVLAENCFELLDNDVHFRPMVKDGARIQKGKVIAHIQGRCYGVLLAERTALNFLGWLSGTSTLTDKFVNAVKSYKAQIMDTRKTIPALRYLQKYAVKIGGGKNHGMGLYDQILIKDNHLLALRKSRPGSKESILSDAIKMAKKRVQKNIKVEVEVKDITEFQEAISTNVDIIMLDNMPPDEVKEAVKIKNAGGVKGKRVVLEASGNITLDNVEEYAETGVDRISVGAITYSPAILDFSLEVI